MTNGIWQSLGLNFVNINVYVGKKRMIVFQVRLFSLYFLDVSYVTYINNVKVTEVALQNVAR